VQQSNVHENTIENTLFTLRVDFTQLENAVNKYHDSLLDSELGKSKSAYGAVKVMEAIVDSDTKTIKKVLTDEKNKDIK